MLSVVVDTSVISLPVSCLYQLTEGRGFPEAVHSRDTLSPAVSVSGPDGVTRTFGGSKWCHTWHLQNEIQVIVLKTLLSPALHLCFISVLVSNSAVCKIVPSAYDDEIHNTHFISLVFCGRLILTIEVWDQQWEFNADHQLPLRIHKSIFTFLLRLLSE